MRYQREFALDLTPVMKRGHFGCHGRVDWGSLAIAGVDAVEGAVTQEQLAGELERLFRPVAPTTPSRRLLSGTSSTPPSRARAGTFRS